MFIIIVNQKQWRKEVAGFKCYIYMYIGNLLHLSLCPRLKPVFVKEYGLICKRDHHCALVVYFCGWYKNHSFILRW